MHEDVVQQELEARDIVAEVEDRSIAAVYRKMIQHYPSFLSSGAATRRIFTDFWPARVLLDPRLQDGESRAFRRMFAVMLTFCVAVHLVTLVSLLAQAWKDIYIDYWVRNHQEDVLSFVVLAGHATFIGYLLNVCIMRAELFRLSTCCAPRPK